MLYQAELFTGRGYGEKKSNRPIERRKFGTMKALRFWAAEKLEPITETRFNVSRALERASAIRITKVYKFRGSGIRILPQFVQWLEPEVRIVPSVGEVFGVDEGYMR